MRKQSTDLLIVAAMATAGMLAPLTATNNLALGLLFGLPLALALPGYALRAAGSPSSALGPAERLAFSLGGSIAVSVLGGLVLDATPWGLGPASWALLLGGITLAACAAALFRRRAVAEAPADATARMRLREIGLFGLAALVAATAFGVAIGGAAQPPAEGFTQLWMLPAAGQLRLGVQSYEPQPARYTVELVAGDTLVRRWAAVDLQPGTRWETEALLPSAEPGAAIELRLYRSDQPARVYRRVAL